MHKTAAGRYNVALMRDDQDRRGLNAVAFARRARVSHMTVLRFLNGQHQTAKTAKKLARALGHDVDRYLIERTEAVA
jgi:transcriptional regulator with XRE-family HTH domain